MSNHGDATKTYECLDSQSDSLRFLIPEGGPHRPAITSDCAVVLSVEDRADLAIRLLRSIPPEDISHMNVEAFPGAQGVVSIAHGQTENVFVPFLMSTNGTFRRSGDHVPPPPDGTPCRVLPAGAGSSLAAEVVYLRGVFDGYKVQLGGLEVRLSTSTPTDLKSQPADGALLGRLRS